MWVCEGAQRQAAMLTDGILSRFLVHQKSVRIWSTATVVSKVSYLANSEFGVRFL